MKRYSLGVKFLVLFLAVLMLLTVAASALGCFVLGNTGMYRHNDYESWLVDQHSGLASALAANVLEAYSNELGVCPQWLLNQTGRRDYLEDIREWYNLQDSQWSYMVVGPNGEVVSSASFPIPENAIAYPFDDLEVSYPVVVHRRIREMAPMGIPETNPNTDATEPTVSSEILFETTETFWNPDTGEEVFIRYDYLKGYTTTIYLSRDYTGHYFASSIPQGVLTLLFQLRFVLLGVLVVSFCLFAIAFVLLMLIAGRDPKTGKANPRGLNRLPLDLYLAVAITATLGGGVLLYELLTMIFDQSVYARIVLVIIACFLGTAIATVDMGFFTALAAQFKLPDFFVWHNSLVGRLWSFGWKFLKKILLWIKGWISRAFRRLRDLITMLPVIWQWIVGGGILGFFLLIIYVGSADHRYPGFSMLLWCLLFAAVVCYCGWCYGIIHKGIQRMNEGNLNEKIHTDWLFGSFKDIAEGLNALADVAAIAAEKQLKSERMKTELITNLSHDIKTPLTSVINYVDLLQQPHTEEEGIQYLEVLSRQATRLKKLVEDLMDMSKATSGNVTVNITTVDAVETVNQALGEFADKLENANLTLVFRAPDGQMNMRADGKLTWRVLSNLLGNVVKYALPGTRVYVDLLRQGGSVQLSVKNISREELNISADELTERFVRGDASRNTEGSGLGLNIAESLMRLQQGSMGVTVDGDLFKVTLTFPAE